MLTVWKFPFPVAPQFELELPADASVLSAQVQGASPVLWAVIDPARPKVRRRFRLCGTGHELAIPGAQEPLNARHSFLGTLQLSGGALVFHLFELDR